MKRLMAAILGTAIGFVGMGAAKADFSDLTDTEVTGIYESNWTYFNHRGRQTGRSGYSVYQVAENGNITVYSGRSFRDTDGDGFIGIAEIACTTMEWRLVQYMRLTSDVVQYDPSPWNGFDWNSKEQQACTKAAQMNQLTTSR